jgi:signal transduction histidine kinase
LFRHFIRAKQPESISKIIPQIERTVNKSNRHLRVLILFVLVGLLVGESAEFGAGKISIFQISEILIFIGLIAALGLLIEIASRARNIPPIHDQLDQLATIMLRRIESSLTKFAKFIRLAIAAVLILLIGVETAEFEFNISDVFHIGEIIIYFVLLGSIGVLVEVILQAHRNQQRSIDLLNRKHKMSLQLLSHHSWDSLTGLMTRQLAEVVDAKTADLFLNQPLTGRLEPIVEWADGSLRNEPAHDLDCLVCIAQNASNTIQPHLTGLPTTQAIDCENQSYCFPVLYKDNLYALFRFVLKPGRGVTEEQQEVLSSISDEVIISLMAGQDRRRISELEHAKTALAERHSISHYLHDNLGQNLGYLRMKLEQFVNDPALLSKENEFRAELKIMKDVADESYRFVRNKLEVAIPESTPLLVNYLQEHAKKVALRSDIAIQFTIQGTPKAVPVEIQQACFFIFQEALANVEKHSHASKVDVSIKWEVDQFYISIIDDGKGFDIRSVSAGQHFGLEIMRERITDIGGAVEIVSSQSTGTTVWMNAPIHAS